MCLAIPGKILEIENSQDQYSRNALVSFGGIKKSINITMVPEAKINDYIIAHVGIAISIIDEEEAKQTLQFLKNTEGFH